MSRSYRKYPRVRVWYGSSGKWGRKRANRKIRRLPIDEFIPNGCCYKRYYDSYNIWDYHFVQFKEWQIDRYYRYKAHQINGVVKSIDYDTLEEALIDWKKMYLCK